MEENNMFEINECYIDLMYSISEYVKLVCGNNRFRCCYFLKYLLDNDLICDTNIYDDANNTMGYNVFLGNCNYKCRLNFYKDLLDIFGFYPSLISGVIKGSCFCEERELLRLRFNNKVLYFDVISGKVFGAIEKMLGVSMDFSYSFVPKKVSFEEKIFILENSFDFDVDLIDEEDEILYVMKSFKSSNTLEVYDELKNKAIELVKKMKEYNKKLILKP